MTVHVTSLFDSMCDKVLSRNCPVARTPPQGTLGHKDHSPGPAHVKEKKTHVA